MRLSATKIYCHIFINFHSGINYFHRYAWFVKSSALFFLQPPPASPIILRGNREQINPLSIKQ